MKRNIKVICLGLALVLLGACNGSPKEIAPSGSPSKSSGIFESESPGTGMGTNISSDVHRVLVEEVLPTDQYNFLRVREGNDEYWIATMIKGIEAGKSYYYKNGVLKTDYENKEYQRVFKRMYLVSNIVEAGHGSKMPDSGSESKMQKSRQETGPSGPHGIPRKYGRIEVEGSLSIAELTAHPEKYEGKRIQISGECVKINPNIMGRNWIHLKDGSRDDYDLVVTSQDLCPEGEVATFEGTVSLNKDFGAGYRYELIVEDGKRIRK